MPDHWDQMLEGLEAVRRAPVDAGAGDPPAPRQITLGVPPAPATPAAELVGRLYGDLLATRRKLDALEAALDAANVAVYRMLHLLSEELGVDPPAE